MKIRLAYPLQSDSIVDGEGVRAVIWTQGCIHNCLGCHNPETHSFDSGYLIDIEELKKEISNLSTHDGITFSGGDPICQVEACLEIAKFCKENNLNIWCYSGYTFEQLLLLSNKNPYIKEFLTYVDVLVDGKFMLELRSLDLLFKGSKNQRIINVKASLNKGKAVLIRKYMSNKKEIIKKREVYI